MLLLCLHTCEAFVGGFLGDDRGDVEENVAGSSLCPRILLILLPLFN